MVNQLTGNYSCKKFTNISDCWLVTVNMKTYMQDDDLLEFVKPNRLLSTVRVGTIKIIAVRCRQGSASDEWPPPDGRCRC